MYLCRYLQKRRCLHVFVIASQHHKLIIYDDMNNARMATVTPKKTEFFFKSCATILLRATWTKGADPDMKIHIFTCVVHDRYVCWTVLNLSSLAPAPHIHIQYRWFYVHFIEAIRWPATDTNGERNKHSTLSFHSIVEMKSSNVPCDTVVANDIYRAFTN